VGEGRGLIQAPVSLAYTVCLHHRDLLITVWRVGLWMLKEREGERWAGQGCGGGGDGQLVTASDLSIIDENNSIHCRGGGGAY
jgi:hypothetical protein